MTRTRRGETFDTHSGCEISNVEPVGGRADLDADDIDSEKADDDPAENDADRFAIETLVPGVQIV